MASVAKADFPEILERNRVIIAQKLQVDRSFLFDYLREKAVFDSEDCERVHAEKTREQRVGKFLDVLSLKGHDAYEHFIDAVQQLSPSLYEALTGQKAGGNGSLDLDIITSHLKRTMQDLQEMTLRYDQVLKENGELAKNLKKTEMEANSKQKRVQELERQRENADELLSKTQEKVQRAEQGSAHQVSSLNRDLNERNTYIIALQMKLLASQESIDSLRAKLGDVTGHRDELLSRLKSISRDYDHQRRESMKLSEKLETQKDDIQKAEGMKLKVRELQFANQKLLSDKDEAQKELNLLKEWTEALKARYDIVEEERRQTQHSHETVVADCSDLRDQINELEIRLMIARREIGDLSKRNADLEQSGSTFKEQRDFYASARKEAIEERDQARRERDEAVQRYNEALNARDQIINQQMEHNKHFETRCETLLQDLQTSREKLAATELEVEKLKRVEVDRDVPNVGESLPFVQPSRPNLHLETGFRAPKNEDTAPLPNLSPSSSSQSSDESFDWKSHRKTKDLIESLKKRVAPRTASPSSSGSESSETLLNSSSRSLDEKLEQLIPQIKALSPGAKECCSLDRNKIYIKSFDTLAWMFEGTVASTSPQLKSNTYPATLSSKGVEPRGPELMPCNFESDTFEQTVPEMSPRNDAVDSRKSKEKRRPKKSPVRRPFFKSASSPGIQLVNHVKASEEPDNFNGGVERDGDTKGSVNGHGNGKEDSRESVDDREQCRDDAEDSCDGPGKAKVEPKGNPNRQSLKDVQNRPAYALASSAVYSFDDPPPTVEGEWTVDEALQSPAIKSGPFRQRSGAQKFCDADRPRSSSAPSQSSSDSGSELSPTGNDESMSGKTVDSDEVQSPVIPELEHQHVHEANND